MRYPSRLPVARLRSGVALRAAPPGLTPSRDVGVLTTPTSVSEPSARAVSCRPGAGGPPTRPFPAWCAGREAGAGIPRVPLDSLLADRGLFESRSRAAAAILAGAVHVGPGRRRAEKPGQLGEPTVELAVYGPAPFVSRGGVKLANALDALGVSVAARRCLDVGASTGGFTDCLLQRGAE